LHLVREALVIKDIKMWYQLSGGKNNKARYLEGNTQEYGWQKTSHNLAPTALIIYDLPLFLKLSPTNCLIAWKLLLASDDDNAWIITGLSLLSAPSPSPSSILKG